MFDTLLFLAQQCREANAADDFPTRPPMCPPPMTSSGGVSVEASSRPVYDSLVHCM